jgi:hypothetical protein
MLAAAMDMESSHGLAQFVLNAHDWYRIETPADYVRATLWCLSNAATAIAYFLIPNEIRHWRRVLPFAATALIARLFIAFIFFCGLSHLAMLFIMQTGPWWAILVIYVPMAIVSIATVVVIRLERHLIVSLLEGVGQALGGKAE